MKQIILLTMVAFASVVLYGCSPSDQSSNNTPSISTNSSTNLTTNGLGGGAGAMGTNAAH